MTLGRQLFAGITAAFLALLFGIEAIYVSKAKDSLEQQLDAHANETATSLALTLGTRLSTLDVSSVNIMVNPVFDRGHFESIEVLSPGGASVLRRTLERSEFDVPHWFTALVQLQGPRGEALISSGWRQLGKVVVRVHPGYAYRQLYDTALATLTWLALFFALALVAMRYHLTGILRPLLQVEKAAIAISNRDFVSIRIQPRTRELQQVTNAINSLSAKIRQAMEQESARAERLRKQAFEDKVTGQLNRRGFEQSVGALLGEGGEIHSGAIALFALSGIEEINRIFGLAAGDALLKYLAGLLATRPGGERPIVGRWQGTALAVLLPNATRELAHAWAIAIHKEFEEHVRAEKLPGGSTLSCGIAHFSADAAQLAQLAPLAERALAQALGSGGVILAAKQAGVDSAVVDIRGEIEAALADKRITLLGQKVISLGDARTLLQVEILTRLEGRDGSAIAAGVFVPVANQHGLLPLFDRTVIEQAMHAMARLDALPRQVSVNVSMQSIADGGFRAALRPLLAHQRATAERLVFEITGYAASRSKELTREFAADIRKYGAQVALDNFELDGNTMASVHDLLPAYIKLAPSFTRQISEHVELRFMVEALLRMLQPLEIPLIAQGVEDEASIPVLAELGLAAFQGYAGGRPEPLE